MALRNTPNRYGSVAKFLHWLILVLIFATIPIGLFWQMTGSVKDIVINIHKLVGLLILGLIVFRLIWAITNPFPKLTERHLYERVIEYAMYVGLYFFMFAIPLTGWLMTTAAGKPPHFYHLELAMPGIKPNQSLADAALEIHGTFAGIFVALVVVHILSKMKNRCRWQ